MNMFRTKSACHAFGRHVANPQPVCRIGADIEVLNEEIRRRAQVRLHVAEQHVEVLRVDWLVHRAPVDVGGGCARANEKLVFG